MSKFSLVFFVVSLSPPSLFWFSSAIKRNRADRRGCAASPRQFARSGCFRGLCCLHAANRGNCGHVGLVPQAARRMRALMRKWRVGVLTALRRESASLYCETPCGRRRGSKTYRRHGCLHELPSSSSPTTPRPAPSPGHVKALSAAVEREQLGDSPSRGWRGAAPASQPPGPARRGSAVAPSGALPNLLGGNGLFHPSCPTPGSRAPSRGSAARLRARYHALQVSRHAAEPRRCRRGEERSAGRRQEYRNRAGSEQENAPCQAGRGRAAPPDLVPALERVLLTGESCVSGDAPEPNFGHCPNR